MIKDNFGRPVLNLRISVTQRCNLHCPYCHREGQEYEADASVNEMTAAEIVRLAKVAIGLSIGRVKLTGGEPLLRADILSIVKGIAALQGIQDLSMTTNGNLLSQMAARLRRSGLRRVNVSLPTLDSDVYVRLMGGSLQGVLDGIRTAVEAGLDPVKVNMLLLAGVNEGEVPAMIHFAGERGVVLQLIELEPINISRSYYSRYHYPLDRIEADLEKQASKVETRRYMQNRRIYHLPQGKVEVIHPIENTEFCAHCTRLRLTSDGRLKPCLMVNTNLVDVLTPLRRGATDEELTGLFIKVCRTREPYYKAISLQQVKKPSPSKARL
jgi:cyclic pyranopterin phosphate synthase